ncbi:ATP synthase gamma chain [Candidatus Profftia lariciata]|uniref:F0F1 ATP synthase subunit gamma n=1 Tax=Candidatus Profftia lariciata TaxID=1987921 RepID=UPI001D034D73|nr:F0F1 ATP synthase subunit gamma [Candidatus Profftia lariciata]UDG81776.1 ATP synthase gamma chain [Candidatus Profftia lariciata]
MIGSKDIRSKITSVQNTQKITQAMEMVASSKMRKTQVRMAASRPYAENIRKVIGHIALTHLEYQHPYLQKQDIKCVGYLVISTDRGLCGSLNINLFKKLLIEIQLWNKKNITVDLLLIGSKAISFFCSMNVNIIAQITSIGDNPSISTLMKPLNIMLQSFNTGRLNRLYIVNNQFINTMLYEPRILQLLPLLPPDNNELNKKLWDYLYEPDPKELLDTLLHRYVESQVYQGIIENLASEQAARMVAMKSATDNGGSLIKELQLIYNKNRQTNITQELTEIVGGASAV